MLNGGIAEAVLGLGLAATFASSALPKLRHPKGFILTVVDYQVLPWPLSKFYGKLLPPLELYLALVLVSGVVVRVAAIVASLLFLSFIIAVGVNLARGRDLDCECLGKRAGRKVSWPLFARDVGFFGAALGLALMPSHWTSAGSWSPLGSRAQSGTVIVGIAIACLALTVCAAATLDRTSGRRGYGRMRVHQVR